MSHEDWRLRYRRKPSQGITIPYGWPAVLYLIWESREQLRPNTEEIPLSIEEIRRRALVPEAETRCLDCGESLRSPTGVPLCGEVEEELISFQLDRVKEWLEDRWEDIHEVLDQLDYQEQDAIQLPEETDEQRIIKGEALDSIDVVRSTLFWMVECGLDRLSQGAEKLTKAVKSARSGDS
jgi:hypothetical protein